MKTLRKKIQVILIAYEKMSYTDNEAIDAILSLIRNALPKKPSENSRDYKIEGKTFQDKIHNEMRFMDQIYGYTQALKDIRKILE